MPQTHLLYVAVMVVTGIVLGVATRLVPDWSGGVPPLLFLLGISLLFDVMVNQQVAQNRMAPLPMPWRAAGFLAGGLLSVAIPYSAQA